MKQTQLKNDAKSESTNEYISIQIIIKTEVWNNDKRNTFWGRKVGYKRERCWRLNLRWIAEKEESWELVTAMSVKYAFASDPMKMLNF